MTLRRDLPNIAPNSAITQFSATNEAGNRRKIRVAMDPRDLADDSLFSANKTEVKGPVLYRYTSVEANGDNTLWPSCRSPVHMIEVWDDPKHRTDTDAVKAGRFLSHPRSK